MNESHAQKAIVAAKTLRIEMLHLMIEAQERDHRGTFEELYKGLSATDSIMCELRKLANKESGK